MLLLASLTMFMLTKASSDTVQDCNYITIGKVNYDKQVLKTNIVHPSELSVDYEKNKLFYSYTEDDGIKTILKTEYLDLNTLEVTEITDSMDIITSTIDNKNHKVYLGGKQGIYKFNYNTNKIIKSYISDSNIWQLFYKDGLYFTTYKPDEQAFYYEPSAQLKQLTDSNNPRMRVLGIDNDSNIYFGNSSGLFCKEKSTSKTTLLIEDIVVNAFNADKNGELYFSTPSSLHHINSKTKTVKTLADFHVDSLWGFAIDENGYIIYGSDDSIIKLVPTSETCEDHMKVLHI